jgi:N-methylhydantoinase B
MKVLYTADGTVNPAQGARMGGPGARSKAEKRERDGSTTPLPACYGLSLSAGERVISSSAGGGGYGSPLDRDPTQVLHDLREGWISPERAHAVYGLVTSGIAEDDTLAINFDATETLRRAKRQENATAAA